MTKKHFEIFAQQIKLSPESLETRCAMAKLVANVAKCFNPNFDEGRFYRACGLE